MNIDSNVLAENATKDDEKYGSNGNSFEIPNNKNLNVSEIKNELHTWKIKCVDITKLMEPGRINYVAKDLNELKKTNNLTIMISDDDVTPAKKTVRRKVSEPIVERPPPRRQLPRRKRPTNLVEISSESKSSSSNSSDESDRPISLRMRRASRRAKPRRSERPRKKTPANVESDSSESESNVTQNRKPPRRKGEKKSSDDGITNDERSDTGPEMCKKFVQKCVVNLTRIRADRLKILYDNYLLSNETTDRSPSMEPLERSRNRRRESSASVSPAGSRRDDEEPRKAKKKSRKGTKDREESAAETRRGGDREKTKRGERGEMESPVPGAPSLSNDLVNTANDDLSSDTTFCEVEVKNRNDDKESDDNGKTEEAKKSDEDDVNGDATNDISIDEVETKKKKKKTVNWREDELLTTNISDLDDSDKNDDNSTDAEKSMEVDDDSFENFAEHLNKKEKGMKSKTGDDVGENFVRSVNEKEEKRLNESEKKKSKEDDYDSDDNFAKFIQRKEKSEEKKGNAERESSSPIKIIIKRTGKKRRRVVLSSDTDDKDESASENEKEESVKASSSPSDSEKEEIKKTEVKKRKRIKKIKDSSEDEDGVKDKSTRKTIRKVLTKDSLADTTIKAEQEEAKRKARILEKQKKYNEIFEEDALEKATVDKVVLDFNDTEELLTVDEKLVKHLKPHQAKGIQFMWNACFESVERAKKEKGSGCILAHCMGLGKTLQVIAFVHTLLTNSDQTSISKVLVVCPLSTVLNWVAEFKKWLGDDDDEVNVFEIVSYKQNSERLFQVKEWDRCGGALIIGYDMFRNLTNPDTKRIPKKMRAEFQRCLVNPGPDVVVCDEGHLLKNEKTSLSVAMNRLVSARRIVLTGTPLQNNLKEYFCMIQFVKPNLLGTYKEYLNRFVNPITNGQYTDSTLHDIQVMRKRSHVLHKLLDGVVQRKDYSVLTSYLPPKFEYVLFVSLTDLQIKLYDDYLTNNARKSSENGKTSFIFTDFQEFQRICTHPRVMLDKSIQNKIAQERRELFADDSEGSLRDFIDDDDTDKTDTPDATSSDDGSDASIKSDRPKKQTKRITRAGAAAAVADGAASDDPDDAEDAEEAREPQEWWRQHVSDNDLDDIRVSSKLSLLFEILKQCEMIGDKVLIFSQSLFSLSIIEYFLHKIDDAAQNSENGTYCGFSSSWSLGLDYFRLDGSSSCDNRASWCKTFNDPNNTRARLFLISTRAGGLGINLVAANRVIIFDVSWNPSHDTQSIYRVYRFGQTKPCYIYRFVTLGTMEMKIYERQVIKQSISKRVIDEQQIDRHYNQTDVAELYKFDPKPEEARPIPLVPKDILLGELLHADETIYKYHEHQSLLENKEDEVLDEEERKAAWEEFENEKKARQTSSGYLYNLPIHMIHRALVNICTRNFPSVPKASVQQIIPRYVQQLHFQMANEDTTLYNEILKEIQDIQRMEQQQKLAEYQRLQQNLMMQRLLQESGMMNPALLQWMQQQGGFPPMGFSGPSQNNMNLPTSTSTNNVDANKIIDLSD